MAKVGRLVELRAWAGLGAETLAYKVCTTDRHLSGCGGSLGVRFFWPYLQGIV